MVQKLPARPSAVWPITNEQQQRFAKLARQAGARNYCVFRASVGGLASRRRIIAVTDNFESEGQNASDIVASFGEVMLVHLEQSMLPLIWSGLVDGNTAETVDFDRFVRRLKTDSLKQCGIAFPIRLGASGNGYVVLTASYLDLSGEQIADLHMQATQIMVDMLHDEEKRHQPVEMLSEREIACLQMAGDGHTSEEIAEYLNLSVHTVNAYLGAATAKLDSVNRIQAIAKAIRLGYIK